MIVAPYEEFKFTNSVASNLYPTSPQKDEDEREHDNSAEAHWHLEDTIKERGKFNYTFTQYKMTQLLNLCCCCFINKEGLWWKRRMHQYDRYVTAGECMTEELDILKYIETKRLANFIGKFVLQRYQRALVQSFFLVPAR